MIPSLPLYTDPLETLKNWKILLMTTLNRMIVYKEALPWQPLVTSDTTMVISAQRIRQATVSLFTDIINCSCHVSFTVGGTPTTNALISLPRKAHRSLIGHIYPIAGKMTGASGQIVTGQVLESRESLRITAGSVWVAGTREISMDLQYRIGD